MQHSTLLHVIFSIVDDLPEFASGFSRKLKGQLEFICLGEESRLIEANCAADHLHMLLGICHDSSVRQVLNNIKAHSSAWILENHVTDFSWKPGYSAFSISPDKVGAITTLITEQQELHNSISFKDELRIMINEDFDNINY